MMKHIKKPLAILLLVFPFLSYAQKKISDKDKSSTIESIKELIHANYVFEHKTAYFNRSLDSLNATGKYEGVKDYQAFADILTEDLVAITKDKHFKIQYNPDLVQSRRRRLEASQQAEEEETEVETEETNAEEEIDWNYWYAQKKNFGFEKVEVLGGNIGYVKYTFFQPLSWAESTIDATMRFVANTDALIIDLRENQGGYSPTDSYLASYFFDGNATLWMSSYERRLDETDSVLTFQDVGGERYVDKSVFILVSENTFSLAERFAYGLKHFNKAIIIGEASAGAAHAIDFMEVNENYLIQLPIIRSVHPVTKIDWEGTGVIPDIETSNEEALRTAHLMALNEQIEALQNRTIVGPILERYEKIKMELNKR